MGRMLEVCGGCGKRIRSLGIVWLSGEGGIDRLVREGLC